MPAAHSATAEAPRLGLPIACEPQRTCFIQHYVDVAPEAGSQDFRCGHATYKGHSGVDFRVLSAAAARDGVAVVAAAAGRVKGLRDGMADAFPREAGKAAIAGVECGNGIVLDHADGWETQYCHLRRGSVRVKIGEQVERGAILGEVGFSGLADSAHLHLTVRRQGKPVDPFTGRSPDGSCLRDGAAAAPLFEPAVLAAFPYADTTVLQLGFAERPLGWAELEHDHTTAQAVTPASPALVFFIRLTHLRAGDRVALDLKGPGGLDITTPGVAVDRNKPIFVAHAGARRRQAPWPAGSYEGTATVIRDGKPMLTRRHSFVMP